jgi:hypothetical protein
MRLLCGPQSPLVLRATHVRGQLRPQLGDSRQCDVKLVSPGKIAELLSRLRAVQIAVSEASAKGVGQHYRFTGGEHRRGVLLVRLCGFIG